MLFIRDIVFTLTIQLIGFTLFFSSCKTADNLTESDDPLELQAILSEYLPKLKESPDDPALFDDELQKGAKFCIELSEPYWLIPQADLPFDVIPRKSNNNVSITIFKNRLYVAFRTGKIHFASKKTGMYIISTDDGKKWKKEMELFFGRDIREPMLIPIKGKLFFYCFAGGTRMTAFEPEFINVYSSNGDGNWSEPEKVLTKGEVHWSMKNRFGKTYLSSYSGTHYAVKGESDVSLFFKQTDNGVDWKPVGDSSCVYYGGVSETAFEFDSEGNLWGVTRLEDGDQTGFGSHVIFANKDDLGNWEFPKEADPRCFMSPKMFRHGDELYLIGRRQKGKKPFGKAKKTRSMGFQRLVNWAGYSLTSKTTALFRINKEARKVEWVMDLPGAGDTAFPSIIRLDKNRFLIANYTSKLKRKRKPWLFGQFGRTSIYLQLINFKPCETQN